MSDNIVNVWQYRIMTFVKASFFKLVVNVAPYTLNQIEKYMVEIIFLANNYSLEKLSKLIWIGTCQKSNCGKYKFVSYHAIAMATIAFQDGG